MAGIVLHLLLLLLVPPLLVGVINKTKSFFSGRSGPPLFQAYRDMARLFGKGFTFSLTTTWVFKAGPVVALAAALLAGVLVPFGGPPPAGFAGDAILFAYLFALSRFFTMTAALDTGSAFEGMGAAREGTFACFAEPILFFVFLALARISGSLQLGEMLFGAQFFSSWGNGPALALLAAGLFVLLLAENCRIPFDDPNTHLELTMIHEVMVLDHSGPLFGLVQYGAAVKLFVLGSVLVRVIAPFSAGSLATDTALFLVLMVLLAAVIGVVESAMARLRLTKVPNLLVAACVLCAFGFLLLLR
ncbi:hydrogenase [bacterium]|nr:MAG: hydrogenase [bacterium]